MTKSKQKKNSRPLESQEVRDVCEINLSYKLVMKMLKERKVADRISI